MENTYLLKSAQVSFGDEYGTDISLASDDADSTETHISIVSGPNGTSKSRVLASIVNFLCKVRDGKDTYPQRQYNTSETHGLLCESVEAIKNGRNSFLAISPESRQQDQEFLPSRILVISNLVMDRFNFAKDMNLRTSFYLYLGVRQASNLTTTGSIERSLTEAIINMAGDAPRLALFQEWLHLASFNTEELIFEFPKLSRREIDLFLGGVGNRAQFIEQRVSRRRGAGRQPPDAAEVEQITSAVTRVFEFLASRGEAQVDGFPSGRSTERLFLHLNRLSREDAEEFQALSDSFPSLQKAGYAGWPTLLLGERKVPVSSLSSGEQNVLAVGSKLISYAVPGSLIVIDEPEVSLNVAWQQRYIDLIWGSLKFASNSHVIIATHSPHLISNLPKGKATLVTAKRAPNGATFQTQDARFEGWGSEAILYQVLGITAASSSLFYKDLASVLAHIQNGGQDLALISGFLEKARRLDFAGVEPLELVVREIAVYAESIA